MMPVVGMATLVTLAVIGVLLVSGVIILSGRRSGSRLQRMSGDGRRCACGHTNGVEARFCAACGGRLGPAADSDR